MEGRIQGDIWYIEHRSFGLDLYIIYKTVANALHGGGERVLERIIYKQKRMTRASYIQIYPVCPYNHPDTDNAIRHTAFGTILSRARMANDKEIPHNRGMS